MGDETSMEALQAGLIGLSEGCLCYEAKGQIRSTHSSTPARMLLLLHPFYHHSKTERWSVTHYVDYKMCELDPFQGINPKLAFCYSIPIELKTK